MGELLRTGGLVGGGGLGDLAVGIHDDGAFTEGDGLTLLLGSLLDVLIRGQKKHG